MSKKIAIIASRGTLDGAYPPFILASTASALGFEVKIFFTFYGLQLLRKELVLRATPLGNPAMPMPVKIPVALQAFPGMQWLVTALFRRKIRAKNIASIEELRQLSVQAGVQLIACQMTVDLFDYSKDDFIDGVDVAGAATFLEFATEADVNLFM